MIAINPLAVESGKENCSSVKSLHEAMNQNADLFLPTTVLIYDLESLKLLASKKDRWLKRFGRTIHPYHASPNAHQTGCHGTGDLSCHAVGVKSLNRVGNQLLALKMLGPTRARTLHHSHVRRRGRKLLLSFQSWRWTWQTLILRFFFEFQNEPFAPPPCFRISIWNVMRVSTSNNATESVYQNQRRT